MKKTLVLIPIILIALISFNSSKSTTVVTSPVNIQEIVENDGTIFHNDMKEAIMAFASEDIPEDSLYVPDAFK